MSVYTCTDIDTHTHTCTDTHMHAHTHACTLAHTCLQNKFNILKTIRQTWF